jgi:hypothetical protein
MMLSRVKDRRTGSASPLPVPGPGRRLSACLWLHACLSLAACLPVSGCMFAMLICPSGSLLIRLLYKQYRLPVGTGQILAFCGPARRLSACLWPSVGGTGHWLPKPIWLSRRIRARVSCVCLPSWVRAPFLGTGSPSLSAGNGVRRTTAVSVFCARECPVCVSLPGYGLPSWVRAR